MKKKADHRGPELWRKALLGHRTKQLIKVFCFWQLKRPLTPIFGEWLVERGLCKQHSNKISWFFFSVGNWTGLRARFWVFWRHLQRRLSGKLSLFDSTWISWSFDKRHTSHSRSHTNSLVIQSVSQSVSSTNSFHSSQTILEQNINISFTFSFRSSSWMDGWRIGSCSSILWRIPAGGRLISGRAGERPGRWWMRHFWLPTRHESVHWSNYLVSICPSIPNKGGMHEVIRSSFGGERRCVQILVPPIVRLPSRSSVRRTHSERHLPCLVMGAFLERELPTNQPTENHPATLLTISRTLSPGKMGL